ncbi:type I toxin-antitoxin system SymE family toxin [Stenotrophomonas sp. ISL-67]|uniref:SymE family type I addiction module toxin n=1 Tax=Stenotrophomonas sp. ISL-67 TaxID=2819171 RepID=UPI001BEAB7A7|nr:type I toxin-antitoxin system SymE family toxin [Stenotrophomonas sp. ISL-67]
MRSKRKPYSRPPRTYRVGAQWYELHAGMGRYEPVPGLRLSGRWLRDAGFVIGAKVAVEVKEGSITLTVIETPAPVAPKVPRKVQQELARLGRVS